MLGRSRASYTLKCSNETPKSAEGSFSLLWDATLSCFESWASRRLQHFVGDSCALYYSRMVNVRTQSSAAVTTFVHQTGNPDDTVQY